MPFTHLDHALQTAAVLRHDFPDDIELAVAGLVHDIGHLLPGVGDASTPKSVPRRCGTRSGTGWPDRSDCTSRPSAISWRAEYLPGVLAPDSVASLALQGGPMSAEEQQEFERLPHAQRALDLRRADERGKVDGLGVGGLGGVDEGRPGAPRGPSS